LEDEVQRQSETTKNNELRPPKCPFSGFVVLLLLFAIVFVVLLFVVVVVFLALLS
jgi:hypothetical protein